MKSVIVIGMGRFGRRLASKMAELGNDVMIVDQNESLIDELAPNFTDAHIGDCRIEGVLRSLGVNNFDICFVTIGENFQSSLEITSLLKELGAKYVVSKAVSEIQSKFLLRCGADEVVLPEREMADKLAFKHNAKNVFDYIEISPEYAIYEIPINASWIGNSISTLNIRRMHGINILAIKNQGELKPLPGPDYHFIADDHMVVIGKAADVIKVSAGV